MYKNFLCSCGFRLVLRNIFCCWANTLECTITKCNWLRHLSRWLSSHIQTKATCSTNVPRFVRNMTIVLHPVLKPVWTYGIELWGCATKSNINVIQRNKSKLLRSITNAPWYVSNQTLHSNLRILHVRKVLRKRTATHRTALDSHPNILIEPLVHPPNSRRLKRRRTFV